MPDGSTARAFGRSEADSICFLEGFVVTGCMFRSEVFDDMLVPPLRACHLRRRRDGACGLEGRHVGKVDQEPRATATDGRCVDGAKLAAPNPSKNLGRTNAPSSGELWRAKFCACGVTHWQRPP